MSEDLPPELAARSSLIDAQPSPVRDAYNYCLCLAMVEAGKMWLVDTVPGEASRLCVFETVAGDVFSLARPSISEEEEAALIVRLREILEEVGPL